MDSNAGCDVETKQMQSDQPKKKQHNLKNTGSSSAQVTLLTGRINHLSEHMKTHPTDHSSRRGLLKMVSHRASLMKYYARCEPKGHSALIEKLGIRK